MRKGWLRHLDFIAVDLASVELSLLLDFLFCTFALGVDAFEYWQLFILIPLMNLFVSIMLDAYNGILQRGYLKEAIAVIKLDFVVLFIIVLMAYFMRLMPGLPQVSIVLYFLLNVLITVVWRFIHKFVLRRRYDKVKNARQIVVAATEESAKNMIKTITESAIRNYQFFGLAVLDRSMVGEKIGNVTVSADRESLIEYVKSHVVDEVFINAPDKTPMTLELTHQLLRMGVTVHIYMEDAYSELPNRAMSNVFGYNVLSTTISPVTFRQSLIKRVVDFVGGIVGCILCIIIGIFVGPAIFICSPGPIIFAQTRIGTHGRPFKFYKFRSMYLDAEERKKELMAQNKIQDGMMFKMDNDPRIIKGIGSFIRKTSLDEFPQFFNVLKGDMSLVGTRPPTADEYERYSPDHKRRLTMRPGITGLWQTSGRSKITDFDEVVRLDTEYIENWTLEQDFKIIIKTVVNILRRSDDAS